MRTCVVRRQRCPARDLLRLVARDGLLRVATAADQGGRSAWVTPDRAALEKLQTHPQIASRTLRLRKLSAGPLLDQARAQAVAELQPALVRAWRSGLLRAGASGPGRPLWCRDDAGGMPTPADGSILPVGLDTLRQWLGPRASARLVLRPGRPARRVEALLRRLDGLG